MSAREVTVTLPEPPSANRWWRHQRKQHHLSEEARAYKDNVPVLVAAALNVTLHSLPLYPAGDVLVAITWRRKRASGDLDKRVPILLDALQGVFYREDSQVAGLIAIRKDLASEQEAGTIVVTVGPMMSFSIGDGQPSQSDVTGKEEAPQ